MDTNAWMRVQEKHLSFLSQAKDGFKFTDTFFPYTSGEIGPYYIQSAAILAKGIHYSEACKDMESLIRQNSKNIDVISGGESRDWMFSFPMAIALQRPHLMIYKNGKVFGADVNGRTVAHVADLNNEGSSLRDMWVPTIKKQGGNIEKVFFYVDRIEDGVQVVKDLGLKSYSLVPLDGHAWQYLQDRGVVSPEVYNNLMQRMEDKDAWATNMLRSDAGFSRLVDLAEDKSSLPKVHKILTKGYPDIGKELLHRLGEHDRGLFIALTGGSGFGP